jgi:L-histidine N-alpha-methyltransferase
MLNKAIIQSIDMESKTNKLIASHHKFIHKSLNDQVHKDFYELFTTNPNKDMLKYAYMLDNACYNDLITQNPDYYLFHDEVMAIRENAITLSQALENIEEVVEIGPGAGYVAEQKTLPLLSYCRALKSYKAIDVSKNYLSLIEAFFRQNTNYQISTEELDLLNDDIEWYDCKTSRAILFLGGTIGNFDTMQRLKCIKQISKMTRARDKLLLTFDLNHDHTSLYKAYDNPYLWNLIFNILRYYTHINQDFAEYMDSFNVKPCWNDDEKAMEFVLIAKQTFSCKIGSLGTAQISSGQKFKVATSRKFNRTKILDLLSFGGFELNNQLCYNNIYMAVASKK